MADDDFFPVKPAPPFGDPDDRKAEDLANIEKCLAAFDSVVDSLPELPESEIWPEDLKDDIFEKLRWAIRSLIRYSDRKTPKRNPPWKNTVLPVDKKFPTLNLAIRIERFLNRLAGRMMLAGEKAELKPEFIAPRLTTLFFHRLRAKCSGFEMAKSKFDRVRAIISDPSEADGTALESLIEFASKNLNRRYVINQHLLQNKGDSSLRSVFELALASEIHFHHRSFIDRMDWTRGLADFIAWLEYPKFDGFNEALLAGGLCWTRETLIASERAEERIRLQRRERKRRFDRKKRENRAIGDSSGGRSPKK